MLKTHRRFRSGVAAVLLSAALVPVLAQHAGAVSPLPITCTASGKIVTTSGNPDTWLLGGIGSCSGDLGGSYRVDIKGVGVSQGLGLCSPEPLPFIVRDLNIAVTLSLFSFSDGTTTTRLQRWVSPVTTYPLGTPFLVTTNSGNLLGAGTFFNHIFLNCQGTPAATFQWAFTT